MKIVKTIILFLLIIYLNWGYSQNNNHQSIFPLEHSEYLRGELADTIIEKTFLIIKNKILEKTINTKILNDKNQHLLDIREIYTEDDSLYWIHEDSFIYNKTSGLLDKRISNNTTYSTPILKTRNTTFYSYDSIGRLIKQYTIGIFGARLGGHYLKYENNNTKNHVAFIESNNRKSSSVRYDSVKNQKIITRFNNLEMYHPNTRKYLKEITIDTVSINSSWDYKNPIEGKEYNQKGDLIYEKIRKHLFIHYEYEYDSSKNWIEKSTFKIDLSGKSIILQEVIKREIKYKASR